MESINTMAQAFSAPRLTEADVDPHNPSGQYLTIEKIQSLPGETLNCNVTISSGMEANDIVRVRGQFGGILYDAPETRLASPPRTLSIPFPKFMLYGSSGDSLNLNFALRKAQGGDWLISQSRYIRIGQQAVTPAAPVLPLGSRRLEIYNNSFRPDDTVRVRLISSPTDFIDITEVTVGTGTVYIPIHHDWFVRNRGKSVWINYSLKRNNQNTLYFSRLLYIQELQIPPNL